MLSKHKHNPAPLAFCSRGSGCSVSLKMSMTHFFFFAINSECVLRYYICFKTKPQNATGVRDLRPIPVRL